MLVASDFAMPRVDAGAGSSDVEALLLEREGSEDDTEQIPRNERGMGE
jgi:hypothetical protein